MNFITTHIDNIKATIKMLVDLLNTEEGERDKIVCPPLGHYTILINNYKYATFASLMYNGDTIIAIRRNKDSKETLVYLYASIHNRIPSSKKGTATKLINGILKKVGKPDEVFTVKGFLFHRKDGVETPICELNDSLIIE